MSNAAVRNGPRDGDANALRPPMDDGSVALAARIAAIRKSTVEMPSGASEFDTPFGKSPAGWSYQWKAKSILGKDNTNHMMGVIAAGWSTVPASRHPELVPSGYTGKTIEMKGQILMEIPTVILDEMRAKERHEAQRAVRDKKASIGEAPAGTMERVAKPGVTGVVSRFEGPAIPDD